MSLIKHAKRELELAGLFDKDSDYDGEIGKAVMQLIRVFSKQGHSGFSAGMTLSIFNKVASYKTLTPITGNPEEWMNVSEVSGEPMWQSTRCPSVFSKDGLKTWYDLDAPKKKWYQFWK
jgi:hypothetical protein